MIKIILNIKIKYTEFTLVFQDLKLIKITIKNIIKKMKNYLVFEFPLIGTFYSVNSYPLKESSEPGLYYIFFLL